MRWVECLWLSEGLEVEIQELEIQGLGFRVKGSGFRV
jgi:hypothetical protein